MILRNVYFKSRTKKKATDHRHTKAKKFGKSPRVFSNLYEPVMAPYSTMCILRFWLSYQWEDMNDNDYFYQSFIGSYMTQSKTNGPYSNQ